MTTVAGGDMWGSRQCPNCGVWHAGSHVCHTVPGQAGWAWAAPTGWRCPGCSRCFAPIMPMCTHCGPEKPKS